jgi:HPt (histidine-containing phosphotransfer) domain-containing protein
VENPANNNEPGSANDLPIFDENAALVTAGGDAELVELLRETCLRESPNIIAQAKTAVSEQDWKTARRSGHSLRSSFNAVGAMVASAKSGEMETVAEDDASQFLSAIDAVESAFQQFVDRLNA